MSKNRRSEEEDVKDRTRIDPRLLRMVVSIGPDPHGPRDWIRIGEGFSVRSASELLRRCPMRPRNVLDPFAGTGTTLIAAAELDMKGTGIEAMPLAATMFEWLRSWDNVDLEQLAGLADQLNCSGILDQEPLDDVPGHIRQSLGQEDIRQMLCLRSFAQGIGPMPERTLVQAAAVHALGEQQFQLGPSTRYDRKGRALSKRTSRPRYDSLENAFRLRLLKMMVELVRCQDHHEQLDGQEMRTGSALRIMPQLPDASYDALVTSPPYFNGFDYGQEYQLDHWFLGMEEELEQMLPSFIPTNDYGDDNREALINDYLAHGNARSLEQVIEASVSIGLENWTSIEGEDEQTLGRLETYLLSLGLFVFETNRVLRRGGSAFVVVDDAPFRTVDVPIGLILSKLGSRFGLRTEALYRCSTPGGPDRSRLAQERQRTCICHWIKG
jgi:hypothetical protein